MSRTAALLLGLFLPSAIAAQDQATDPFRGRVSPEVAVPVTALADSLSHRGLPGRPLIQKAMEGSAKGVPADRILAAVRVLARRLDESAAALHAAGVAADSETVEAGAYALNAGLGRNDVAEVARASRPPHQPAGSLRSAGTLVAMGVSSAESVTLVRQWIATGHSPADVVELPAQVQAAMAPGISASQAASGMARGQGANPPQPRGPPPNRPPSQPDHPGRP